MSAKTQTSPTIKTSARMAALSILLSVVFGVLGIVFLLSQMTFQVKSYVLSEFSRCLKGLCGELCLLFPVFMLFVSAKLLVSTAHRVSARDVLALGGIYLCLLAGMNLITYVTGTGNLMEYIRKENARLMMTHPDSFGAYLRQAYMLPDKLGQTGGGLIGMVISYPLWRLLGQVVGIVVLALACIALFLHLLRIHPLLALRRMGELAGERPRKEQAPVPEPPRKKRGWEQPPTQSIPVETLARGQQVTRVESVYQPATAPVMEAVPQRAASLDDGFTAMGGEGMYNERMPLHDEPAPTEALPVTEEAPPAYEEMPPVIEEAPPAPAWEVPPYEPAFKRRAKQAQRISEDDEPPFDIGEKPAQPAKPEEEKPSWAAQVKAVEKRLDRQSKPSDKPKPVYTDPVMPLTGERVPITPTAPDRHRTTVAKPAMHQLELPLSPKYTPPPITLLEQATKIPESETARSDAMRTMIIERTLDSFGIPCNVRDIQHGPTITRFAIEIAPGIKVSKVAGVADNLALDLKTKHVRVEAPIQGTNYIGIEVPNLKSSIVSLREVLDSQLMRENRSPLVVALGQDVAGMPVACDLRKMPHLLIAGATGSGKSVCINTIICSLIYRATPQQVRLIMIDPKQVELSIYNALPHLIIPVISDPKKAGMALQWVVTEMIDRYGKLKARGAHNLEEFNDMVQGTDQVMPNIVVIIDEMADLMDVCRKDVEESIRRLAALARAAGIYMVLATQRPSVDVITGVIKNNIPSRIAFSVSSGTDSRTIIDMNGAEKLLQKGDMLFKQSGANMLRVQGCLVKTNEINAIIDFVSSHYATNFDPDFMEQLEHEGSEQSGAAAVEGGKGEETVDEYLSTAIEFAVDDGQISASMLQRRLSVGYARASRLVDEMEKRGIISKADGAKPRKTLITREQFYEEYADL